MGGRRGSRGAFQSVGGDTGTDTEVPEGLRGYGGTRTLATWELVTAARAVGTFLIYINSAPFQNQG